MKIQINTQTKTVAILENCKIDELIEALKGMLGEDYKNYSLEPYTYTYTYTYWYQYPWYQWQWNQPPIIPYYGITSDSKAIYNVEIN